jgi:hypothetical protein
MTAKEKKAFVERMRKARARATRNGAKKKAKKNVTRQPRKNSGVSQKKRVTPRSRKAASGSRRVLSSSVRRSYTVRRNPDLEAEAEMYRIFHGRAPEREIEYEELLEIRSKFAEMGKLLELRFDLDGETSLRAGESVSRSEIPLTDFGATQAVCTADGTNIYFLGGDQKVDLSQLSIESDKDYVELGPCTYIKYFTKKGFHNFEPVEYWHRFGEENGIRPVLAYDSLNRKLFLIGGDYSVKAEGITN